MVRSLTSISAATLLLIALGGAALHAVTDRSAAKSLELVDGVPYAVTVTDDQATLDLEFSKDDCYLLIISALGDAAKTYDTHIESKPIPDLRSQPLTVLSPLSTTVRPADFTPPSDPQTTQRDIETNQQREFFLHVTDGALEDPRAYHCVTAHCVAEGKHVRVYLDGDQSPGELCPGLAEELVRLFDEEILPTSAARCGLHRDVDGDGKFVILLTHWLGKLQGGGVSLGGFVRSGDFQPGLEKPFSNHADLLYLNSSVKPGPELRSLLAHEYAHAVLFSARHGSRGFLGGARNEEDWLNEAIAHIAENWHSRDWSNLDHRVAAFLENPAEAPLVVPDYYRSGRWRDHGCRGATFLFMRWLVDTRGDQVIPTLTHSRFSGIQNLSRATGTPFAELFRHWTIALAEQDHVAASHSRNFARGYTYLSLHDKIGQHQLHGVARELLRVEDLSAQLTLQGTTAHYLELRGSAGTRRLTITAPESAKLQLTLIKQRRSTSEEQKHSLALVAD